MEKKLGFFFRKLRQLYQQYLRHLSTIKKRIRKKTLKTAVKIDEQRPDVLKTHATGI
jgi:hypothetical protein